MSVSDAHHACDHDAHMIFAHHACIMIARVMRGVAWHAGGAAWRGAMMRRARRRGRLVADRKCVSDARHARDHDACMIRARS